MKVLTGCSSFWDELGFQASTKCTVHPDAQKLAVACFGFRVRVFRHFCASGFWVYWKHLRESGSQMKECIRRTMTYGNYGERTLIRRAHFLCPCMLVDVGGAALIS
eukprot:6186587-Pleurochrysis_carterae.AAC.6